MGTVNTKSSIGFFGSILIGIVGAAVSAVVTMQVKKMLEAKGLPERTEDLKAALKKAGVTAADLKTAATDWINAKAQDAAVSAADTAHAAADKVEATAGTVKEQANG